MDLNKSPAWSRLESAIIDVARGVDEHWERPLMEIALDELVSAKKAFKVEVDSYTRAHYPAEPR